VNEGNRSRETVWIWLSIAGIALSAAIAFLFVRDPPARLGASVTRTTILLPPNQIMNNVLAPGSGPTHQKLAVSPDGQSVVYVASTGGRSQLFIRGLAEFDAKPLPHTDGANFPTFSPDGRWVAFFANYRLQKVLLSGGAPIVICEVPVVGRGASWGPADTIVFSAGEPHGLWRVSASGGKPEQITTAAGTSANWHSWPYVLPDGKSVVFTIGGWGPGGLALLSLSTREWKPLLKTQAKQPRYLPTGHLVYAVEGALRAVPFDLGTLRITGSPVPVLDPVFDESGAGGTEFAVSDSGTLVFLPGGVNYLIVWVDRSGRITPLTREPRGYRFPDLSPDDAHVTVTVDPPDQGDSHIWIYDVSSGTGRRLTHESHNLFSAWTADGSRVAWGADGLWWQSADGAGNRELLSRHRGSPNAFSPDGRWLLFHFPNASASHDLAALPLTGDPKPISVTAGPSREIDGAISRDGRWLAFSSDESGSSEIYVQPFPLPGRKVRVSTDGGNWPVWVGNELFYVNGPQMIAVRVQTGDNFRFGKPEVLFEDGSLIGSGGNQRFDATRDGQKFLMIRNTDRIQGTQLRVVLNWFEELKAKVPTQ
jgi:serine/threonine-protein kinase